MKLNTFFITPRLLLSILLIVVIISCKKNNITTKTIKLYTPVYSSKTTALASINRSQGQAVTKAGKIYIKDNYIFLNDLNKGIHIIDNSNPSQPVQIAFLSIPGNLDIAVKGNILYADMYNDLLALDISNPRNATITRVIENFFTGRAYVNGFTAQQNGQIATDWLERDTIVEVNNQRPPFCDFCAENILFANAAGAKATGTAGSMAGMVLMDNYLYAITESHSVGIIDISNAAIPKVDTSFFAGFDLQTIFPFKGKLFLGSSVGMFMYDVADPKHPVAAGQFEHGRACDPVIADDNYAYVTLHAGDGCGGDANELHVIDINDLQHSKLVKTYSLTKPTGLSKDGNILFVCDETEVKIYNATNPSSLMLLKKISSNQPYDVITLDKKAIIVCNDGLYQYDYSNLNSIRKLSFINAKK